MTFPIDWPVFCQPEIRKFCVVVLENCIKVKLVRNIWQRVLTGMNLRYIQNQSRYWNIWNRDISLLHLDYEGMQALSQHQEQPSIGGSMREVESKNSLFQISMMNWNKISDENLGGWMNNGKKLKLKLKLTSEKMVFQAASRHELVYKKSLVIL